MRLALVLCLGSLALPASAAAAVGTPPLRLVSANGTAPSVQGGGWLMEQRGDTVRLTNERDGRVVERPLAGCTAMRLRNPKLLLECPAGLAFTDVRSGTVTVVRPRSALPPSCEGNPLRYHDFGRHWIAGGCLGHSGTGIGAYVNWRTGEARSILEDEFFGGPLTTFSDLDDPALAQKPLLACRGVPDLYRVRPEWILLRSEPRPTVLRLRACAGGPETVVARDASRRAFIVGDHVIYESSENVGAYSITTGKRYRWTIPPPADPSAVASREITATERRLYVALTEGKNPNERTRLFRARLP